MTEPFKYDPRSGYTPKLTVKLPDGLRERLRDRLPWGMIRPVMAIIMEDLVVALENDKEGEFLALLLGRIIKIRDWVRKPEKEDGNPKQPPA